MKIVDVIWQKPVSTYAISACEALVASVNSVAWTFTRMLTPVLMKLNKVRCHTSTLQFDTSQQIYFINYALRRLQDEHQHTPLGLLPLPKYTYGQIAVMLSPFFKYGSESSRERKFQGTKVPWSISSWDIHSWGAKVPWVRKFHGAKVLGLFAPREWMFQGTKVPR